MLEVTVWTLKRIFPALIALPALEQARRRAAKGRRMSTPVAEVLLKAEHHLLRLHTALQTGRWVPRPSALRLIYEPKPRAITISPFENNWVHHALVDGLEPLLARSYLPDTFACLEGRGAHRAVLAHQGYQGRYRFLLQLDIHKYFPSIPHGRLLDVLGQHLRDRDVMRLFEVILAADEGLYERPEVVAHLGFQGRRGVGVPVGTLTSQFFGNYYLNDLDHFIKRQLKVPGYLRYMDNLTCFGNSRSELRAWHEAIGAWLESERGLSLKPRADALRPTHARILYLGYEVTREAHRPAPLLYYRVKRRLERLRLTRLSPQYLERLKRSLSAYAAVASF